MLLFSTLQRISPIQRPYYITSSYSYQFFEKSYFCFPLQYRSVLVAARMRNKFYSTLDRITSGEVPIRVMAEIL